MVTVNHETNNCMFSHVLPSRISEIMSVVFMAVVRLVKKTWFAAQISITRNVGCLCTPKHLSKLHYVDIFVGGKHCSPI